MTINDRYVVTPLRFYAFVYIFVFSEY